MRDSFHWRRFGYALAAFVGILVIGMAGFQWILGEGWIASFYRSVVTTTLTAWIHGRRERSRSSSRSWS